MAAKGGHIDFMFLGHPPTRLLDPMLIHTKQKRVRTFFVAVILFFDRFHISLIFFTFTSAFLQCVWALTVEGNANPCLFVYSFNFLKNEAVAPPSQRSATAAAENTTV